MVEGVTGLGNEAIGPVVQGGAPPILWDVGMDMTTMGEHPRAQPPPTEGLDDGMMFWTHMSRECMAVGGDDANVTINDKVGTNGGDTNEPARKENPRGSSPSPFGLDDSEGSYTDSSHEDIGPLTQPTSNGMCVLVHISM